MNDTYLIVKCHFFLYYIIMADGINIEGGFDDIDLTSDFLDGTIKGVLLQFANNLQTDLRRSIDSKGLNYTMALAQEMGVAPTIVEFDNMLVYTLEYPIYGAFQDEGVSGTQRKFNTPYSFKNEFVGRGIVEALSQWGRNKFGLNVEDTKSFGFGAAKNKKRFGVKPTYWLRDVITDGRIEALEDELGKSIAFAIIERA